MAVRGKEWDGDKKRSDPYTAAVAEGVELLDVRKDLLWGRGGTRKVRSEPNKQNPCGLIGEEDTAICVRIWVKNQMHLKSLVRMLKKNCFGKRALNSTTRDGL